MQYARIVTLNIGGNNILEPFWEHLPDEDEIQAIVDETTIFATQAWELTQQIIDFVNESQAAIEEVLTFANEAVYFADNFGITDIFRVNQLLAAAPPVIDGATAVFAEVGTFEAAVTAMLIQAENLAVSELLSLFSGTIPPELESSFHAATNQFLTEFTQIITRLEYLAPNAVLIINTIYNPLPTHLMGIPLNISHHANRHIQSLNNIIRTQARNHIISDIYSNLSQRPDLMNANIDIIHPNPLGHTIIANQNYEDFMNR
jgi:hypothetical protein